MISGTMSEIEDPMDTPLVGWYMLSWNDRCV
jgi:hypothetical protein